jgi:hypothetical protein
VTVVLAAAVQTGKPGRMTTPEDGLASDDWSALKRAWAGVVAPQAPSGTAAGSTAASPWRARMTRSP